MPTCPQIVHRAAGVLLAAIVGAVGCNGDGPPGSGPQRPLVLEPVPETTWVRPGDQGPVSFVLHTIDGEAVPMRKITFAIVDDPAGTQGGSQPQGATLTGDNATTDINGLAQVDVVAGQSAVFRVRATSGDLEAEAVVVVATGLLGSVEVAPFFAAGSSASANVTRVEILFFDNMTCRELAMAPPPPPARTVRTVPVQDGAAQYDFVSTALNNAILGRARDGRGAVQAGGCVDLPGSALVTGGVVRIALPLNDASPSASGLFAVTSRFSYDTPLLAAQEIATPWRDLQDCPLDPAQLWLDCTLDALSGPVAGDPNDCQPQPAPAEGALAAALAARRGVLLPMAGGGVSACRGTTDAGGAISYDGRVMGMFGSPKPKALVDLHAVAGDAARILESLVLKSRLKIRTTSQVGVYQATHTFIGAEFALGMSTNVVPLLPLALPVLEAPFVTATEDARSLVVGEHGITLRLGTAARVAFGELALAPRALPTSSRDMLQALTALAVSVASTATAPGVPSPDLVGCAALDSVLCKDLGQPAGCLAKACQDGLTALAARLDAGFAGASGEGLDFMISGSAPLLDPHGSGFADRLGDAVGTPGTWSAKLQTRAGDERFTGLWDAFRIGN